MKPPRTGSSLAIHRRDFLHATAAGAWTAGCSIVGKAKPNLVLILTDQQHIDTIAARGAVHLRTPALDELARRGTSFGNSYCADPVCSPSRSAIFTGRMPSEADVADNGRRIRAGIPNLGEWFSANSNYETVYAGKWHLPRSYQDRIPGFSVLPGGIGGQGNLGDPGVARACEDFLFERSSSRPFLLAVSFLQPHDICEWLRLNMRDQGVLPYPELLDELPPLPANFEHESIEPRAMQALRQSNEPAIGRWSEQHWRFYLWSYYRHVEMIDGEIARIVEALDDTGRASDTVVLFTSDHGEGLACHQMVRKSSSYEESLRIPFVAVWPGQFSQDRHNAGTLLSGVDIVPTLCECAGIPAPPNARGLSARPVLEGKGGLPREAIFAEIPPNVGRVVRTQRYKYITFAGDTVDQLFDMESDPGETRNLAGEPSLEAVVTEHKARLKEWESSLEPAPGQPHANAWWRS